MREVILARFVDSTIRRSWRLTENQGGGYIASIEARQGLDDEGIGRVQGQQVPAGTLLSVKWRADSGGVEWLSIAISMKR